MTERGHGRLARIRLTYPDHTDHPAYDAELARELLIRTSELPARKRALVVLLTEYRRALADLTSASGTADTSTGAPREGDEIRQRATTPPRPLARST